MSVVGDQAVRAERERRVLTRSIVAGVVVMVLVAAAGISLVLSRGSDSIARASLVVLPSKDLSEDRLASYYETLNNGQITPTFAEVLKNRIDLASVTARGVSAADRAASKAEVKVVPQTALIEVSVTAPSDRVAVALADGVATASISYVNGLGQPYVVDLVAGAQPDDPTSTPDAALVAVAIVVALAVGLGAQQVSFQLTMLLARRRGARVRS
jgi:capsular polysaccharide biosynthesis protein